MMLDLKVVIDPKIIISLHYSKSVIHSVADHFETFLQIIWHSDLGIFESHSFAVDNLAPNLPISSEHFAPYPFPPATKVIPSAKVSMYGAIFPGVCKRMENILDHAVLVR